MDAAKLSQLKLFVEQVETNPTILQDPQLLFFRKYLERVGAKLPKSAYGAAAPKSHQHHGCACAHDEVGGSDEDVDVDDDMPELEERNGPTPKVPEEVLDEIVESDVELDNEGVVEGDNEPPQKMGDPTIEVTEEMWEKAQESKMKAVDAVAEGKIEEALAHYTDAIVANPTSAIPYSNRAGLYIKLKKPNAAIRDANAAINLNPDSAKGYKFRGEGNLLLGKWEEAAKDLYVASKLDFDEQIEADLKKVRPNVQKLEEHRRKYERLRKEREEKKLDLERQKRKAQAKASYEAAKKKEQPSAGARPGPGPPPGAAGGFPGFPGAFPGGPAGSTGPGGIDMSKILSDPELMAAFQDPEVMTALQDVMKNPANLEKHKNNPKVAPVITKMLRKFGGGAPGAEGMGPGMPEGMGPGMPGMPGAAGL